MPQPERVAAGGSAVVFVPRELRERVGDADRILIERRSWSGVTRARRPRNRKDGEVHDHDDCAEQHSSRSEEPEFAAAAEDLTLTQEHIPDRSGPERCFGYRCNSNPGPGELPVSIFNCPPVTPKRSLQL